MPSTAASTTTSSTPRPFTRGQPARGAWPRARLRKGQRRASPTRSATACVRRQSRLSLHSEDDRALSTWSEDPILDQVETLTSAAEDQERPEHGSSRTSRTMVVKAVDASGGYGMLFGPKAARRRSSRRSSPVASRDNPRGYIAQPVVELSDLPHVGERIGGEGTGGEGPGRQVAHGAAPRGLSPLHRHGQASSWVLPGRAHARGPRAKAATSSTRAREAAARTPGSWAPTTTATKATRSEGAE